MKGRRGMGDFVVDDEDEEYTEPKHKKGKKAESEEEDMSDGSASDASDASETDSKKRVKKEKVAKTATKRTAPAPKPSSAPSSDASSTRKVEEDGVSFELSGRRKLSVRKYRGKVYVDIREFYLNDAGAIAPGRKGISLDLDQYNKLKELMPAVDAEIASL